MAFKYGSVPFSLKKKKETALYLMSSINTGKAMERIAEFQFQIYHTLGN